MRYFEVESYAEMSKMAANLIASVITCKPNAVLGLATGSTPIGTYNELIRKNKAGELDFSAVRSVNLDEYYGLSGDNDQSYRYFMNDHLFNHINIDINNTNVPNGLAKDPKAEGERYDALIKELGGVDIQLLGIGVDGHIGFNEPDSVFIAPTHLVDLDPSTIEANSRFFDSADDVPRQALTMGMMSIMKAKKILMVVSGENKKKILDEALNGPVDPKNQASMIQLHPDVTVIYTKEAN